MKFCSDQPLDCLCSEHLRDLRKSGLSEKTIVEAGFYTFHPPDKFNKLLGKNVTKLKSVMGIPYPGTEFTRFKLFPPLLNKDGKKQKYYQAKGSKIHLYIPATFDHDADNIYIVEGEKKTLKGCQEGLNCFGLSGLWNWKVKGEEDLIDDFSKFNFKGKKVYLVPDNDWRDPKKNLTDAVNRLGRLLERRGAKVSIVQLPEGQGKIGLDDYLIKHSAEDFRALPIIRVENVDHWEAPILLESNPVPNLEPNLLPGILGEMVEAVSISTETPPELATGLVLPVISTALQGKFRVQVNCDHTEPVNIWTLVALESGNRKSSVLATMTQPLTDWEMREQKRLKPIIKEAEIKQRNHEARLKHLRARYGKAKKDEIEEISMEILEFEKELEEIPNQPQIWTQDVTTERLGSLMDEHDEKMTLLSAEGGIFDILAGKYSSGVPNFDLYLQGYSGDSVKVDRGCRPPLYLKKPALSLGLSPQPDVLRGLVDKPGFKGRGLLGRFLYLLPDTNLGYRTLKTEPIPEEIKRKYHSLIASLLGIEQIRYEDGQIKPYILRLSKQAKKELHCFALQVEKDLREGERFEFIKEWGAKLPGAVARIAGLFHCAENPVHPWANEIGLGITQRAIQLAYMFAEHTLLAFDLMGADKSLEQARKIWRWAKRKKLRTFTKRDCFNDLRGTFRRVTNMDDPFEVLRERHYMREFQQKTGGRPSIKYNINPALSKGW